MSKKILAMFLAVLMVVSVLPTSVLAADNCPIAKGEHSLDNCADYTPKEVVAATCAKPGYTTYECDACGDVFTGNFTAKLAHEKSSTVEAAKDPTYTEVGHLALYHCDACDQDWFEVDGKQYELTEANKDLYETPVYNDATEFPCPSPKNPGEFCLMESNKKEACSSDGLIYTCAYCDRQIISKAEHEVSKDMSLYKVVKEPTTTAAGEAEAPCTKCQEMVTIVIYPNHDHTHIGDRATVKYVDEAKDCVNGDVKAHYACVICPKVFELKNGALKETTLAKLTKHNVENRKHTVPDNDPVEKKATCTVAGKNEYNCARCGDPIVEIIPAGHNWNETIIEAKRCGQDGIVKKTCVSDEAHDGCGLVTTATDYATPHSTLEEYQAAFAAIGKAFDAEALEDLQDADNRPHHDNCYVKDGAIFTGFLKPVENSAVCGDEDGGVYSWPCLKCGELQTTASPALEHTLVTYTVPATCSAVSYTFQYCVNAHCTEAPSAIVKSETGKSYSALVKTQEEKIEAIADKDDLDNDGNKTEIIGYHKVMKDVEIEQPVVIGTIISFGTEKDADNHHFGLETKVPADCTTAGTSFKKCSDCGEEFRDNPPALGHTLITNPNHATMAPVVVEPTCKEEGSITYYCKTCGELLDKNVEGGKYVEVLPKVIELKFNDFDKANAAHNGALVADPDKNQDGDCVKFGYEAYACADCSHTVIVTDGTTGSGHSDSNTYAFTEAGKVTVPGYNNGGYIFVVSGVKNGQPATGDLPVALKFTIGSTAVEIKKFGTEVMVEIASDEDFEIELTALAFTNKNEDDVEEDDIYEFTSYEITVYYFTKKYPTCTEDGAINAHDCINPWCSEAEDYFEEEKINKLDHKFETVSDEVKGVCGELDKRAEVKCSRSGCGVHKVVEIDGVDVVLDGRIESEIIEGWDITQAKCENQTPHFDLYYCSACETYHIRNYKPVVPHTWGEDPIVDEEASCAKEGKQHYECTVCGASSETEIIPAEKHKNAADELFTDHCNDPVTDRHCKVCCTCDPDDEDHDCTEKNEDGEYDCDCMIGKYHSVEVEASIDFWKAPTCTTAGSYVAVCEYCKVPDVIIPEFIHGSTTVKNEPVGHIERDYKSESDFDTKAEWLQYQEDYKEVNGKEYISYVAATVLKEGSKKFICAGCGKTIEESIDALANLQFSLNASNADAPECDKFATYSLVALTVKASGIDATLAGFKMTVEVYGNALFVGYKWAENTPFLGDVTEPTNAQGQITIVGRVIGSNEIAIEDEALVTLYFRVLSDVAFGFENDTVYAVNAVEEIESSVQGTEIEVIAVGNVNGDDNSSEYAILDDLQAAINIFMGVEGSETYNVAADINRNGEIDLQDLQLMCKIASGNLDMFDLWFLDTYEGEVDLVVALYELCLECHGTSGNHLTTCSKHKV